MDPTWGAGFIKDSEFIKRLSFDYFEMLPGKAIKSHMPFDPLWQLSEYPINNEQFKNGYRKAGGKTNYFDYCEIILE